MTTLKTFLISDKNTLKCDVPNSIAEGKKAHVGTCEITEKIAAPSDYKSKHI